MSELEAAAPDETARPTGSPILEVFALPSFRRYWFSQLGIGLVNGTMRFAIVWLVLELSDWAPAVGLVGLALGVPAVVVTLPAGALSDRVDRVRIIVIASLVNAVGLVVLAVAIWTGIVNLWIVAFVACVAGTMLAVVSPAMFAIVPSIVPPERLLTGVGLQGMSMNIALLGGAVIGGATIAVAGTGGAMALLAVILVLSALGMAGVELPAHPPPTGERRMVADTMDGLRVALGREPLRSMLVVGFVASTSWGVVQLTLPDLLHTTLGQGAFTTSLVFAGLAAGMFTTTLTISNRHHIAHRGLILATSLSGFLGTMIVVMGLSRSYALTFVAMVVWGITGGLAMTLQRTLLQEATPSEYMGRVMGCNAFAMAGSYPIAASVAAVSTAAVGASATLVLVGTTATVMGSLVVWRRAVWSL